MKKIHLYKKPFITATVFIILGLIMFFGGLYFAARKNDSDFYAMVVFGFILIVISLIVFCVYGALERKFDKVINKNVLLNYVMSDDDYIETAKRGAEDIKTNNKTVLIIMLIFCVIIAILGPFIADDGYIMSFIALGLGAFLTIAAFIATRYRVNKLKKGSKLVVLSKDGAYVYGEFHSWNVPGSRLIHAEFVPQDADSKNGYIKIYYQALTVPSPTKYSAIIPILDNSNAAGQEIARALLQNV